jgi:predicted PurR-regulated permease PerM
VIQAVTSVLVAVATELALWAMGLEDAAFWGSFLTPSLMGRVAEMNNVAVFVGLLFWSWMWGVPGMLLAVPLMMIIKAVCDGIEDLHPIGRFLGE